MRIGIFFAISTPGFRQRAIRARVGALLVAVLLAVVGCSASDDDPTTSSTTAGLDSTAGRERPPSPSEEELAPLRQMLYRECNGGDDAACTELATLVDEDSEDYTFAVTCGGREDGPVCAPDPAG
jgi:hypothetical protein